MNASRLAQLQRPISVMNDTPMLEVAMSMEQIRNLQKIADDLKVASCAINAAIERMKANRLPIDTCGMFSALMVCGHIGTGCENWVQQAAYENRNSIAMDDHHARQQRAA